MSSALLRALFHLCASLAVDGAIVAAVLWWGDDLQGRVFLLGMVIVWGLRLAVGLRNLVARALFYFLGHGAIIDQMVQHMRLTGYPRDVSAADWVTYCAAAIEKDDLPRKVLLDIGVTHGHIAGAKQVSVIAGAIVETLTDRAVSRYLS